MKNLLIISLLALSVIPASAKKKNSVKPSFNLRAGLGYALPVAGNQVMVYGAHLQAISGTQGYDGIYDNFDVKKASFSAGLHTTIAPGIMFTDHLGLEVAAGFGIAMKKYTLLYTSTAPGDQYNLKFTSSAQMPVIIMPSIIVSSGDAPLSVYSRAGLALAVAGKIVTKENYSDGTSIGTATFEVKNSMSLGVCGAAGLRYKAGSHIGLWFEINGLAMSLHPKTGEYTSYISNGQPILNRINVSDTHYEYESNYSNRVNTNTSLPTKATTFATAFSNIGLALGVSIKL